MNCTGCLVNNHCCLLDRLSARWGQKAKIRYKSQKPEAKRLESEHKLTGLMPYSRWLYLRETVEAKLCFDCLE